MVTLEKCSGLAMSEISDAVSRARWIDLLDGSCLSLS